MANLEQLQAPSAVILEDAAKILSIDLGGPVRKSMTELLYQRSSRSQGFKEQWMLRWLLKKLGVSDSKSKASASDLHERCGPTEIALKLPNR